MELINNRYRIVKKLKQSRLVSIYLVSDILDEYKGIQLNLFHSEFLPNSLIEFYSNNFIGFSNLVHENLAKDYKFGVVAFIDNKKVFNDQLFFTCEYIENPITIIEMTKNMNVNCIIEVFVEVCKAINYLHLRGYTYGELNINNLMISKEHENCKLKLKDLATIELEKNGFHSDVIDETCFKAPGLLSGEQVTRESDIYALGVLLLCLLRKTSNEITNVKKEFEQYKEELENDLLQMYHFEEIDILKKLLPILEKLLSTSDEYPYQYLSQCFDEINSSLERNYSIFKVEDIEKLNFNNKLVGREELLRNILKSYDYMIKYKPVKRIFFVQGDAGSGKTRFLQEIEYQLSFKKADVYSSYSLSNLKDSSNSMWVEILRKLISESDTETIEKYETELIKFFPEIVDRQSLIPIEYLNRDKAKYRLLNRIAGFISDSVKNKPTVIIIDNIHLANEFTIETIKYLATEITKYGNIIMVFSYRSGEGLKNEKFFEFVANVRERKDADVVNLRDLDFGQSCELIRSILSMPYIPLKLSEKIYSQSYGNPLFITEVIKHLYSRKIIYISKDTGLWHSEYTSQNGYQYMPIPNSIEQAILNQLKDSDETAHEILEITSIFSNPISIEYISKFMRLDLKHIETIVLELVQKGLLCRKIGDISYVYEINNKVLKDIIYEKLSNEEKVEKHRVAASILEMEKETISNRNFDELIMHYEKAGVKEKVKMYCLENAKQMELLKDRKEQIRSLEKAITMIDNKNKLEKADILLKISKLYFEAGEMKQTMEYCIRVEKIAKSAKDDQLLFRANLRMANVYQTQNEMSRLKKCVNKCKLILQNIDDFEGQLDLKRFEALFYLLDRDYTTSYKMYQEIVDSCGEEYIRLKGEAYRQIAYIYGVENKIEEALDTYKKAVKYLESSNTIRSVLIAYNNIGALYSDFYQDMEMALEYFDKVKDISEDYNYPATEILALINIACIYQMRFEYQKAYDYFKMSLEKALKADCENDVFFLYCMITGICLKLDNYAEAYEYYLLSKKELENFPDQGKDITVYYKNLSVFYYVFGDFGESEKYIKKALKTYGKEESFDKIDNEIYLHWMNLRSKQKGVQENTIKKLIVLSQQYVIPEYRVIALCNAVIILTQQGDLNHVGILLEEAKKSLIGPISDEVQAHYLYAAGLAEKGEASLKLLMNALDIAKKTKSRSLSYRIITSIGDYYFEINNMNFAANYYVEAFEIAKELSFYVPEDYKLPYANNSKIATVYNRINYIKALMYRNTENTTQDNLEKLKGLVNVSEISSYEELTKLYTADIVTDFIGNNEFIQSIRELYMSHLPINISSESDILANIGSDTTKNIELVIKYLATLTLSTNGLVVINEQQNQLKIIASLDNKNVSTINKGIFDRVKASGESLLITDKLNKNESDIIFLSENQRACICIPITNRNVENYLSNDSNKSKLMSTRTNILGFLYLESDRILNNFNNNGMQKCTEFVGFLALLLEKHQLKRSASIDLLTGALTRKYLEDALNDEVEKASIYGNSFSIIMYDLDRFKNVNDKFGHQTGDEVLKKVSLIVKENIGRNDVLGRYGGEEFIIILPGTGIEDAILVAEELRKKIHREQILGDKVDVTVSMGVAAFPMHGQFVQELVEKADQALYVAKENGRNRCQVWDNKFSSKVKGTNKLNGIISGNAVQDSRNVLAIVELIKLVNSNQTKKEKIYYFLGRIIEIMEAQYGAMLIIKDDNIVQQYGRKALDEEWTKDVSYNKNTVKSVIDNKQGVYMIDWDAIGNYDLITGIPDWYSILVVPISIENQVSGVIYLSTSTKVKEFGFNEFNFINVLSDLAATII